MAQNFERRILLRVGSTAVISVVVGLLPNGTFAALAAKEGKPMDMIYAPAGKGMVTGKGAGDFDFLAGEWRIRHQRLQDGTKDEWQYFESGATVHRVLNGMGSIEELRKADGGDMGMGIRVWLPPEKKWADHWTGAANGVVNPPQKGEFIDGEGVFISEEEVDDVKWLYRGVWDKIATTSCRWHQSASKDGGKTWEWNWWMEWTRVGI
jgi:hypothetical protein